MSQVAILPQPYLLGKSLGGSASVAHLVVPLKEILPAAPPLTIFQDNGREYAFYAAQTGEKTATAGWVAEQAIEIARDFRAKSPQGHTFNYFEGGLGSGLTTASVIDSIHDAVPEMPITVVAKEFSGEHVMEGLDNLARLCVDQRNFSFAISNLPWANASTLKEQAGVTAKPLRVIEVRLEGNTEKGFLAQLARMKMLIPEFWATKAGKNGAVPANQALIVVSRADRDPALPLPQFNSNPQYHSASIIHAWRLAGNDSRKAGILAPVAENLQPGIGKLFAIQAAGGNTGEKITQRIWGDETPFRGWDSIVSATQAALGDSRDAFTFSEGERIELRAESGLSPSAALRLAVYAAQVPLAQAQASLSNGGPGYAEEVLAANGGDLTFSNETLVISRQ